ncbi:adenylyltransferase/cytidyltransferase family protein [Candidatus Uhrbacteria bacterium]|nr:adenylyltransferase/cytidyltransferase family protein [Candidatus Uhrbacteria bacterium]
MNVKSKTVLAFGTFDVLHPGHITYLEQARKKGDRLAVIVARDITVKKLRGELPIFGERDRLRMVGALKCVDMALLGDARDHIKSVERVKPDVLCLGYDHRLTIQSLKIDLAKRNIPIPSIVRLRHYKKEKYKSSIVKSHIRNSHPLAPRS